MGLKSQSTPRSLTPLRPALQPHCAVRTVEDDRRLVVNAAGDGIDIHGLGLIDGSEGVGDADLTPNGTLVERRALLRKHLRRAGAAIIYSEHLEGADGEAMFRHACGLGLEGIVSKRATSRYKSGRCAAWVKVKNPTYERR